MSDPGPPLPKTGREALVWLRHALRRRGWLFLGGALVSLLFLWLSFREVSLAALGRAMQGLDGVFVALALGISVASTVARAARWRLLYYPDHHRQPTVRLAGLLFISQMLNVLIPARAGELSRILLMRPVSAARTLGTIGVEKVLDLITLLAFTLILPFILTLPAWFVQSSQSFVLLALMLFGVSLLLFLLKGRLLSCLMHFLRFLPHSWHERAQSVILQALESLEAFRVPWLGLRLQGWSFLIWGMGVWLNYLLFRAFDFPLSPPAALFLLLVMQVGTSVPAIPGKLGVFQYLTILALGTFGIEKSLSLSYSIVLYLVAFGPHFFFGVIFGLRELRQWTHRHELEPG